METSFIAFTIECSANILCIYHTLHKILTKCFIINYTSLITIAITSEIMILVIMTQ